MFSFPHGNPELGVLFGTLRSQKTSGKNSLVKRFALRD